VRRRYLWLVLSHVTVAAGAWIAAPRGEPDPPRAVDVRQFEPSGARASNYNLTVRSVTSRAGAAEFSPETPGYPVWELVLTAPAGRTVIRAQANSPFP
jgi:hypothetical protein